jgi:hypothetical protein
MDAHFIIVGLVVECKVPSNYSCTEHLKSYLLDPNFEG